MLSFGGIEPLVGLRYADLEPMQALMALLAVIVAIIFGRRSMKTFDADHNNASAGIGVYDPATGSGGAKRFRFALALPKIKDLRQRERTGSALFELQNHSSWRGLRPPTPIGGIGR